MKKSKKIILTISAVTLTAGVLLTGVGYMMGGRFGFVFSDGKFISADNMDQEKLPFVLEKKKLDSVKNIDIHIASYADIEVLPSKDNAFYLEYTLPGEYPKPVLECADGTLTLSQENQEPIAVFGFGLSGSEYSGQKVTLYVPEKAELSSCKLYSNSGNIQVSGLTASDFGLGCDYGDVILKNVTGKEQVLLTLNSGDFTADTISGKTVTVNNDSGNLSLNNCTSDDLHLESDYGDINLDHVTVKRASNLTLDSGDLTIQDSSISTAKMTDESGNMSLCNTTGVALDLTSEYGDVSFTDTKLSENTTLLLDSGDFSADNTTFKTISVKNDSGNVSLSHFSSETADFSLSYGDFDLVAAKAGSLSCTNEIGDISIQLSDKFDSYGFDLVTEYGEISLPADQNDALIREDESSGKVSFHTNPGAKCQIQAECEDGNIQIR